MLNAAWGTDISSRRSGAPRSHAPTTARSSSTSIQSTCSSHMQLSRSSQPLCGSKRSADGDRWAR
eukprot:6583131-Pyramimonas_sp.AAC.1